MSKEVKVTLRFYSGQDDDLIAWMENLQDCHGKKGEFIKNALRLGVGLTTSDKPFLADRLTSDERAIAERAMSETDGKKSRETLMQNNFLAWVRKSRILMAVSLVEIALLIIAVTTWRENGIAITLLAIIPITIYTALVLISGYREHRQHDTTISNRLKGMDNLKKRKVLALMDVAKNSSSEAVPDARAVDGK